MSSIFPVDPAPTSSGNAVGVPRSAALRRRQVQRIRAARAARGRLRTRRGRSLIVGLGAALLMVMAGGQAGLAFLDAQLGAAPSPHPIAADSLLFDRSGTLIADLHPNGDTRLPVALDQIAPVLQNATVSIEDRSYWSEGAANPSRVAVAAVQNLLHQRPEQGASTIAQQLAKVRYLDDTKSYDRKVRELFIARNLQDRYSKQDILDQYLNDIYYGNGATGIEAASQTYFGIPASRLDLAQAAMLAGLPNQPSQLDPLHHPQAAADRQLAVLKAMVSAQYISADAAGAAIDEKLTFADGTADNVDLAPAFAGRVAGAVRDQLHLDPYTAGLRITTTLDIALQRTAQKTVADQVDAIASHNATDGALVSINPSNGDVVAYVGTAGNGHPGSQIDMAAVPRQPGSTFKLFTYSAAIADRKVTMTTPVLDGPYRLPIGGGADGTSYYQVQNYDLSYHGVLPIAKAFANSLNVPAVKVEVLTGIPDILKNARALGVTTLDRPDSSYGASMTLGTYPVPLWQMAQAGGVFADGGRLQPARVMLSAKDLAGHELLPSPPKPKQAIDAGAAFIMNAILTDDTNRQLEFGLHSDLTLDGHLVSAKTGTTEDFRDNFTVGWTPHLVTAAWVGNADNQPMHGTTGITGAAPIWHAFMTGALKDVADDWPPPPSDVSLSQAPAGYSRYRQAPSSPAKPAYYLTGTGPGGISSGAAGGTTAACPVAGWTYMILPNGDRVPCGGGGTMTQPASLVNRSTAAGGYSARTAGRAR